VGAVIIANDAVLDTVRPGQPLKDSRWLWMDRVCKMMRRFVPADFLLFELERSLLCSTEAVGYRSCAGA
jgi:hypothetical protein